MPAQEILLVVDAGMRRTPAFDRAVHLARRSGAALHLLMVDYFAAVDAVGLVNTQVMKLARRAHLAEREEWLRELALDLRSRHLQVSCEVLWGRPAYEKIIAQVRARKPDLVIKDLSGTQDLPRLLSNPSDWQLLRLCPAPLLLVRQSEHVPSHRVLAAVDPVHESEQALQLDARILASAQWLCAMEPAELHLLHACGGMPPLPPLDSPAGLGVFTQACDALQALRREKFQVLAQASQLNASQQHLLDEPPSQAIARCCRELQIDTLVLGTLSRSELGRALMGSTAERVLAELDCDVLAVKPADFEERFRAQRLGEDYGDAFAD